MKKIKLEKDVQIPGTDVLLEAGDIVSIVNPAGEVMPGVDNDVPDMAMATSDHLSEMNRRHMTEALEEACAKREGNYREAGRMYERELRQCGSAAMREAWDEFEEGMRYEMDGGPEYPMESRDRRTPMTESHSSQIAMAISRIRFDGEDAYDAEYLAQDFAQGIQMGLRRNTSIGADYDAVIMMLADLLDR